MCRSRTLGDREAPTRIVFWAVSRSTHSSTRPLTLTAAAAVEALEGLAVLAVGLYVGVEAVAGSPNDLASAIVLALMAILVTIYATLGQTDKRVASGLVRLDASNQQTAEIADYFADMIGRGSFALARNTSRTSSTDIRDPNLDRFFRTAADIPISDPVLATQTLDPSLRYTSQYLPSDVVPTNEKRPPLGLAPDGAGVERYALGLATYLVKLGAGCVALAVFETSIAKMRVFRVPNFLGAALMLGFLGTLLLFVSRGM